MPARPLAPVPERAMVVVWGRELAGVAGDDGILTWSSRKSRLHGDRTWSLEEVAVSRLRPLPKWWLQCMHGCTFPMCGAGPLREGVTHSGQSDCIHGSRSWYEVHHAVYRAARTRYQDGRSMRDGMGASRAGVGMEAVRPSVHSQADAAVVAPCGSRGRWPSLVGHDAAAARGLTDAYG